MRTSVCGNSGFFSASASLSAVSGSAGFGNFAVYQYLVSIVSANPGYMIVVLPLAICIALSTEFQLLRTSATACVPLLSVASFASSCCICPAKPALRSRNCFNDSNSAFFSLIRVWRAEECVLFAKLDPPSPEEGRMCDADGSARC